MWRDGPCHVKLPSNIFEDTLTRLLDVLVVGECVLHDLAVPPGASVHSQEAGCRRRHVHQTDVILQLVPDLDPRAAYVHGHEQVIVRLVAVTFALAAVVGAEHHQGVVCATSSVDGVQQLTDLRDNINTQCDVSQQLNVTHINIYGQSSTSRIL